MPRPKTRFTEEQLTLPLEYFTSASDHSLENFEQSQLNHAANLDRDIKLLQRERDKAHIMAEVARLLINNRAELLRHLGDHLVRVRAIDEKTDAA